MPRNEVLADRLASDRLRYFVGRESELAMLRKALAGEGTTPRVIAIHGPGGIGKTALLQRFAAEAQGAGRPVVSIDAARLHLSRAALEAQAAEAFSTDRAVLLLDSFEQFRDLEPWLHDEFLPRLPACVLVVLAGRFAPDPLWRADVGWSDILHVVPLGELSPEESAALLVSRGVDPEAQTGLLRFAAGNPLALRLATEAAQEPRGSAAWAPTRTLVQQLLARVVGEVPSLAHRRALEVCGHAQDTTEELLRAVLPEEDSVELFAWLQQLPFMRPGRFGLHPDDVVRDSLDSDLLWRDPDQYKAMHRAMRQFLVERMRVAPQEEAFCAASSYHYVMWRACRMDKYHGDRDEGAIDEQALNPKDANTLVEMTRATEGEDQARAAAYWMSRQPWAFTVHRRRDTGEILGFMAWLVVHVLDDEARAADPLMCEVWETASAMAPLQPGEHLAVARFAVHPLHHHQPSRAWDLVLTRVTLELVRDRACAWSCLISADPDFWRPLMTYMDMYEPPTGTGRAPQASGLFFHDWRSVGIDELMERLDDHLFSTSPGRPAHEPLQKRPSLSRQEVVAAVQAALRCWFDPDQLAANPLVHSRLVQAHGNQEPVAVLREIITKAMERLETNPTTRSLRRVVATTFQSPSTQEAAARKLNMAFSTYRRHLTKGVEEIGDRVWRWESQGRIPDSRPL